MGATTTGTNRPLAGFITATAQFLQLGQFQPPKGLKGTLSASFLRHPGLEVNSKTVCASSSLITSVRAVLRNTTRLPRAERGEQTLPPSSSLPKIISLQKPRMTVGYKQCSKIRPCAQWYYQDIFSETEQPLKTTWSGPVTSWFPVIPLLLLYFCNDFSDLTLTADLCLRSHSVAQTFYVHWRPQKGCCLLSAALKWSENIASFMMRVVWSFSFWGDNIPPYNCNY